MAQKNYKKDTFTPLHPEGPAFQSEDEWQIKSSRKPHLKRRGVTGFSSPIHLIADFKSPKFIENSAELKRILLGAAKAANNTPLKTSIYKFPVQGITGVVLLAESHIAIHTWPEHDYIAIDIFTCGKNTKPYGALEYLKKYLSPKKVKARLLRRGNLSSFPSL